MSATRHLPGLGARGDGPGRASEAMSTIPGSFSTGELQVKSSAKDDSFASVDVSVLAGISPQQLTAIVQLIQSGALQTSPGLIPSFASMTSAQSHAAKPPSVEDEQDREDGEITDIGFPSSEDMNHDEATKTLSVQPNLVTNGIAENQASTTTRKLPSSQQSTIGVLSTRHQQSGYARSRQESEAKDFLIKLHQCGYGFNVVSKHINNIPQLQRIYSEAGIDIETVDERPMALDAAAKVHPAATNTGGLPVPAKPGSAANDANTTKTSAPTSRSEYLARLAAAKAKTSGIVKAAQDSAKVKSPKPESRNIEKLDVRPPPPRAPTAKSSATTDLIRQRLEALRASQAAKSVNLENSKDHPQPASAIQVLFESNSSLIAEDPQGSTISSDTGVADQSHAISKPQVDLTFAGGINRLPGLFMAQSSSLPGLRNEHAELHNTAVQPMAADDIVPLSSQQVNRKRPLSATLDSQLDSVAKRPFGQSRPGSDDEQVIIHPSDDEDGFDENDVNGNDTPANHGSQSNNLSAATPTAQGATPLYSPSSSDHASAYDKKVEEIAAFRRLIEEREKRMKAGRKAGKSSGIAKNVLDLTSGQTTPADRISAQLQAPIPEVTLNSKPDISQSELSLKHLQDTAIGTPVVSDAEMSLVGDSIDNAQSISFREAVTDPMTGTSSAIVSGEDSKSSDEMDTSSESDESSLDMTNHDSTRDETSPHESKFESEGDAAASREFSTTAQDYDESSDEMDTDTDDDESVENDSDSDIGSASVIDKKDTPDADHDTAQRKSDVSSASSAFDVEHLPPSQDETHADEKLTHVLDSTVNEGLPESRIYGTAPVAPVAMTETALRDKRSPAYFTRYESPLTRFRGGMRSPMAHQSMPAGMDDILCPYETTGGRCNDKTCQYRHFSTLGLSGA